ncbi:MAG TPA: Cro/CI family transcriptional regulator [Gammaproteobacteria bacterium]|nr:Cro/CI family transcriptional regulator [Gammaproteobacteria bacterium]
MKLNPLLSAIKHCGGQTELARAVSEISNKPVGQAAVSQWLHSRVPAERCIAIQEITDGKITVHQLRPDVFGSVPAKTTQAGEEVA